MHFWSSLIAIFGREGALVNDDAGLLNEGAKWLFSCGTSNTDASFGFSAGSEPDPDRVEAAARILGRPVRFVDKKGYQREMFAAALNDPTGTVAYVETRAKQLRDRVDIGIHLHVRAKDGREVKWEIISYNPYFGCNVRFMEWFGETVLMIYREKHKTYVCRIGLDFRPACKEIGDYWIMNGPVLASRRDKNDMTVARLSIPTLSELPSLSQDKAKESGVFPAAASLLPTRFWQSRQGQPP
jgi:hypothetical protein